MFCTNCGSELPDGTKFCFNCGAHLEAAETPAQPEVTVPADPAATAPATAPAAPTHASYASAGPTPPDGIEPTRTYAPTAPDASAQVGQGGYVPQTSFSAEQNAVDGTKGTKKKGGKAKRFIIAIIIAFVAFFVAYAVAAVFTPEDAGSGLVTGSSELTTSPNADDEGNITIAALIDEDGEQVEAILKANGYEWSEGSMCYLRQSDMAAVAALDANDDLMDHDVLQGLAPGADGDAYCYVNSVAGYTDVEEALTANAQCDIIDSEVFDEYLFAVVAADDGAEYLVYGEVSAAGDGTINFWIYGDDALAAGCWEDMGSSVDEAWELVTDDLAAE